jgi:hypothetical protein
LARAPPWVRTKALRAASRAMSRRIEIAETPGNSAQNSTIFIADRRDSRSTILSSLADLIITIIFVLEYAHNAHPQKARNDLLCIDVI